MNEELHPYQEYKDSGVAWLGAMPAHWDVLRCKYIFREIDERSTTGEETHLSMSQKLGLVPSADLEGKRLRSESYIGGKLCQPNDLVLNRLKAHLGVFAPAKQAGVVSPDYTVLRPLNGDDVAYFELVFKTPECIAELRRSTKGIVEGFWRLYTDDFYNIRIPVPAEEERAGILRFVDGQDLRIRKFIRNRRRLIEMLSEQKQAIINQVVTRGLDPTAPLKPSGTEWLGNVPEHWQVHRLRNVADLRVSNVDKHTNDGEFPVRLCNYTDVYKNSVITADMPFMTATATADEIRAFRLQVGDVIITKDSEDWQDIGVPALVAQSADDLVCGYHLAILRPRPHVALGRFLAYAMQARGVVVQLSLAANGVTRYGLSHGAIKAIAVPVPPVDEQEPIARYIDDATADLNEAIRCAKREIELIREYRTRLVADVVTGRLDVRQHAAKTSPAKKANATANIHFRRSVFAAEIVHRLHDEPTFGHVKFEKLVFLCEKRCGVDTGSTYHRQAAGPYDNRALRSIDSQLKKQRWYEARKRDKGYRYESLEKAGGHKEYFERYFGEVAARFDEVIETFRTLNTQRCEIVATLYAAWEDLLARGDATDDQIIEQVLHHWHPSKQQIDEDRWRRALEWMKSKGLTPDNMGVLRAN